MTYWLSSRMSPNDQSRNLIFFLVEKFGWFQKRLANSMGDCKINDNMALHSLKFDGHQIVLTDLTCSECLIDAFCNDCETL